MTSPDQNYTSWHCGMKVVLVHERWNNRSPLEQAGNTFPERGQVYTIRSIGIHLIEIENPVCEYRNGPAELAFSVENFRPVQTRKTSIEIFTAMLSPKPAKAKKVRA